VTFDDVRAMALALPMVEEATSYESPAFRIRKRLLARLHADDALAVKVEPSEREALLATRPDRYFLTPHYQDSPDWILVRLAVVDPQELAELLTGAWKRLAPPRLVAEFED
jgi:hypothetical protein